MPSARTVRLRHLAASVLAGVAIATIAPPVVGAEAPPATAAEATAAEAADPESIRVPGTAKGSVAIPQEFLPPPDAEISAAHADLLSAAAVVADFTGDVHTRDAVLAQLSEQRRTAALHVLDTTHSPVATPDLSDPSTHLVILGNGLRSDGTVHPNLANRLSVAEELAAEHPHVPVVLSGGRTEHGHVEAEAMRDWLVDRGLSEDRLVVEGRSWSTVSNAWNTNAILPGLSSLVVVTSESHLHRGVVDFTLAYGPGTTISGASSPDEPPVTADPDGERFGRYRDAVLWYVLPDPVIADGLPPLVGPGIPRFF